VAMFLNTVGHNLRNRLVATNYDRSGETVSCYFNKVDRLVEAFTSSSNRLATSIEKLAKENMYLPNDLYDMMKTLPDFNRAYISFYYSYLVANPHIGRAFYNFTFDVKMDWVVEFITAKFSEN
jgi:hypothetical protein